MIVYVRMIIKNILTLLTILISLSSALNQWMIGPGTIKWSEEQRTCVYAWIALIYVHFYLYFLVQDECHSTVRTCHEVNVDTVCSRPAQVPRDSTITDGVTVAAVNAVSW